MREKAKKLAIPPAEVVKTSDAARGRLSSARVSQGEFKAEYERLNIYRAEVVIPLGLASMAIQTCGGRIGYAAP